MPGVKEKKRAVQFECQNCESRVWVKKGTLCHRTDLCGKCSHLIDGSTWSKMKGEGEQDEAQNV